MIELQIQDFQQNQKLYLAQKEQLSKHLGHSVDINHIGSTAIPNMVGKNIIDILIGANNKVEFEKFRQLLIEFGFFASQNSKTDFYQFFASQTGETKYGDIHLHLVIKNTERYDEFLILKEYLLNNPDEAQNYSSFKQKIINEGILDRKLYRSTKSEYVTALINRAKEYFHYKEKHQ